MAELRMAPSKPGKTNKLPPKATLVQMRLSCRSTSGLALAASARGTTR